MNMRERLARAAALKAWDGDSPPTGAFSWDGADDEFREHWLDMIDAILREMMELDEEILIAAGRARPSVRGRWQAMLRHILDEGRGDKENAA